MLDPGGEKPNFIKVNAVAITGGVASGKSTFAAKLAEALDWSLFNSDLEVRTLLNESEPVRREIMEFFGQRVFDDQGRVDRARLREMVFSSTEKRRQLERILHPRVRRAWTRRIEVNPQTVVEIPLLYEAGADRFFDLCVVVGCSHEIAMDRLQSKRGLTREVAEAIYHSQMSLKEKMERADLVIWNDGSPGALADHVHITSLTIRKKYAGN